MTARFRHQLRETLLGLGMFAVLLMAVGCASSTSDNSSTTPQQPTGTAGLNGSVYGGRQPIAGATLYLFAASTSGYAAGSSSLLTSGVISDASGNFTITSKYSCTGGQQIYIVSLGGNSGAGINVNAALMAALGDCNTLTSSRFISMNEVTTVASVFALAPFMSNYSHVGSSATNGAGLVRAFASVNKLANISTGSAPGPSLPTGATAPTNTINTIADVLAACVNSTGGTAGDGSACGNLFSLATPLNGTAPTDTIGLALALAQNPALHANTIFSYIPPQVPFAPHLLNTPNDWTLAISYSGGGLNAPKTTIVDAVGNIWVANFGNNTITILGQSGVPNSTSPLSGNGLNGPVAIAMDSSGNAWVVDKSANQVSVFSSTGLALSGSPFTNNTFNSPTAIAIDTPGNVWITNSLGSSVTELNSAGNLIQEVTSGIAQPSSIAINPQ